MRPPSFRCAAAAAMTLVVACGLPAQATSLAASYTFTATAFDQGGTLSGSISGTLLEWLLAPMPPFAAGSSRMTLPGLGRFSASFSGSSVLPDASFDLAEVISVTLVDDGTFGAGGGQPATAPALFDLVAHDTASDSDLFIRFAALPGAVGLLSGDPGAGIDWQGDDLSARLSQQVHVQLDIPPVPMPHTLALALAGLALIGLKARR
jgi:hypothetical protein